MIRTGLSTCLFGISGHRSPPVVVTEVKLHSNGSMQIDWQS
jgi:hypothetical protein